MTEPKKWIPQTVQSEHADPQTKKLKDWIILTDPPGVPINTSGCKNVKQINEPQDRIIGISNESTNPQDQITETLEESRSHIRTHKPLNAQNMYMYAHAA